MRTERRLSSKGIRERSLNKNFGAVKHSLHEATNMGSRDSLHWTFGHSVTVATDNTNGERCIHAKVVNVAFSGARQRVCLKRGVR